MRARMGAEMMRQAGWRVRASESARARGRRAPRTCRRGSGSLFLLGWLAHGPRSRIARVPTCRQHDVIHGLRI